MARRCRARLLALSLDTLRPASSATAGHIGTMYGISLDWEILKNTNTNSAQTSSMALAASPARAARRPCSSAPGSMVVQGTRPSASTGTKNHTG